MAIQAQYNDTDYKNWIQTCLGLQFLKEGIVDYVDTEAQKLHRNIIANVCQSVTCNGCTTDDLTRRRRPCPKNVCDKIRNKLQNEHRYGMYGQPEWNNTDATRWCTDHWEMAKCFMPKGYKTVTSSADTDTAGLLSVCINGRFMPCATQIISRRGQPPIDSFHKIREARNVILHSGSMGIKDKERQNYIQDMVGLLATYKQPVDSVTQDAIQKLRQLNGGIFITPTDELSALKANLQAIDTNQQVLQSTMAMVQQERRKSNATQRIIEGKVETVQQEQKRVDVNQQHIQQRVGLLQKNLESKIDTIDASQRNLESAVEREQNKVDVKQRELEKKVDVKQLELEKKVDVKQLELEKKVDTLRQEHEQAVAKCQTVGVQNKIDAMQKRIDFIVTEDQIKKNGESLVILNKKLVELQKNTGTDVSEVRQLHRTLHEKNNLLNQRLINLSSRVEIVEHELGNQQLRIDKIENHVVGEENRIAHLEDAKDGQQSQIRELMEQTGSTGAAVDHFNDQIAYQEAQINTLEVRTDIQESRMDLLEMDTGSQLSGMNQLIRQTSDHATHQESRLSGIEDVTRNLQEKVTIITLQAPNEARALPNTSADLIMQAKDKSMRDIQHYLLEMYKKDLCTMPVPPPLQRIKANIDDIYVDLLIRDDLVHNEAGQPNSKRIKTRNYQDILNDGTEQCKEVFVVGKAGVGKTTWSRKLIRSWCYVRTGTGRNYISSIDRTTLLKYDLMFLVELRHARSDSHILKMIEHQIFPNDPSMMADVKALLEDDKYSSGCLIVLDGLDEWVNRDQCTTKDGLPARDPRWKSTIVTTTRSWKLEALNIEPQKIDRAVEITGLPESGTREVVEKVVSALNDITGKNKNAGNFVSECHLQMHECMHVPLLLIIFVYLWYEEGHIAQSLAEAFCGLIDLLIKYAEWDTEKRRTRKNLTKISDMKQSKENENVWIPSCIARRRLCGMYYPVLLRLGKLGFDHLFSKDKETSLVFDHHSIKNVIDDDELELALKIGILSRTTHRGSLLKQEFSLSFLHKSVQEFLAALYMASEGTESNPCLITYRQYCNFPHNVLEMESVLLFVSGLCPELAGEMSRHIADMERDEIICNMMLRCVRQERATTSMSRHIYIKHLFLIRPVIWDPHRNNDGVDYNMETVMYLNNSRGKDTTLHMSGNLDDDVLKRIADIKHVKLTSARFCLKWKRNLMLDFSQQCESKPRRNCEPNNNNAFLSIRIAAEYIEDLDISIYRCCAETVLDLTACKSLRVLKYVNSLVPIKLPVEQLQEVSIAGFSTGAQSLLDMSECQSLKTLNYQLSTVPICLPTEYLQNVEILYYRPSNKSKLDLSGCNCLRNVRYKHCTVPLQFGVLLDELEIINEECTHVLRTDFNNRPRRNTLPMGATLDTTS